MIDTNYSGNIFCICHGNVPKCKKDFVNGKYNLYVTGRIAVKIVDMLDEESLYLE